MSVHYPYYRPTTPPHVPLTEYAGHPVHTRHASNSSAYSNESSSPWSVTTSATSPGDLPPRQLHHGPALLPKIRPQDVVIEPASAGGPPRNRRVLSNPRNPPAFMPYPPSRPSQRTMDCSHLGSSMTSGCTVNGSELLSPVSITSSSNKRKASSSPEYRPRTVPGPKVDEMVPTRYDYSTPRQLPRYTVPPQGLPAPNIVVHQPSPVESVYQPPVVVSKVPQYYHPSVPSMMHHPGELNAPSTTLLSYLTTPTQAIKLVRNVNVVPTRGMHDYFWWDIRNIRSWPSFSLPTFDSINGLTKLLKTEIPSYLTPPTTVHPSYLAPESESSLISLIHDIYAPRVNSALAVSQGPDHLRLYSAPAMRTSVNKNYGCPHFLANYASDTERTISDLPRGRLVGIVKSFDRWNTGMRNEAPPQRVEYLNGLAHLQRCMREHSCRYGFIMTEIELVCVRAGCDPGDDVPYFGYMEVSNPIPTNLASFSESSDRRSHYSPTPSIITDGSSPASSTTSSRSRSRSRSSHSPAPTTNPTLTDTPLTATLGLYFLLMLSKSVPLPSQPSAHLNVGGLGALTRQRILPEGKDSWIPVPQIGEKRDAKRVRGWVMPLDPWHRREGGSVKRGPTKSSVRETRTGRGK